MIDNCQYSFDKGQVKKREDTNTGRFGFSLNLFIVHHEFLWTW